MKPRILLVEDDAVSRAFLTAAVEALPATVDAVETCAEALRCAQNASHDLWLLDANLPDGSGASLLAQLQKQAPPAPALAHTASQDHNEHDALLAAGFQEVLVKPLPATALHAAIRRLLGQSILKLDSIELDDVNGRGLKFPHWDDAAALSALNGQQAHVLALRGLFLDELAGQCRAIDSALAAADVGRAGDVLHKLRASCGFVGAARVGEAARMLESDPQSAAALQRFQNSTRDLLEAAANP